MKYQAVAAAFSVLVHTGQAAVPTCALACLQNAVASSTTCSWTDILCQCAHSAEIEFAASSCVIAACGEQEALRKNPVTPFQELELMVRSC